MMIFEYKYQNSFRFCFVILSFQSRWGLKNNGLNLHKKTTNSRILVVEVKLRHLAIVLILFDLQCHGDVICSLVVWTIKFTSLVRQTLFYFWEDFFLNLK